MRSEIRPLLKWVGGKRQLLPQLRRFYPAAFAVYIEPFFGSGAVFFDLWAEGRLHGRDAVLIDANQDLIGCYQTVRDAPEAVLAHLEQLAEGHAGAGHAHYYEVRDRRFNPLRAAGRDARGRLTYSPELAAMLIYLNRTGYNGLFRVNSSGAFNVPAGRYVRPRIADRTRVMRVAEALAHPRVTLLCGSFDIVDDIAARGDFLYFDPPYAPVSRTANFTSYTADKFAASEQARLKETVVALARRGCFVLLSNSTAGEILRLYEDNDQAGRDGLRTLRVRARRAVNRDARSRGVVDEVVVTNIGRDLGGHRG